MDPADARLAGRPCATGRSRCARSGRGTARPGARCAAATATGCARGRPPRRATRAGRSAFTRDGPHAAPRRRGAGSMLPFVVEYDGRLVGQLTVGGHHLGLAVLGARRLLGRPAVAGRGVMPTAVALAADHCFRRVGLHRIEVNIRPENAAVAAGRREARLPRRGHPRRVPAHRRRLARPPVVRADRRGGAGRSAAPLARVGAAAADRVTRVTPVIRTDPATHRPRCVCASSIAALPF